MYDVGYRSLSERICSIPWYSADSLADWSRRVIILLQELPLFAGLCNWHETNVFPLNQRPILGAPAGNER